MSAVERDEEGFVLDEYGQPFGCCNSCGEEAPAYVECCDDGEVVPYDDPVTSQSPAAKGAAS